MIPTIWSDMFFGNANTLTVARDFRILRRNCLLIPWVIIISSFLLMLEIVYIEPTAAESVIYR